MSKTSKDGTKHKIYTSKCYYMSAGETETCIVCGKVIILYEGDKRLVIDAEFIKNYPLDVVNGDYIYHTCSEPCKELLQLNPLVYA